MFLLVGLGNPGSEYATHRHNIGFMTADDIIRRHSFSGPKDKFQSDVHTGTIKNEKAVILKPQTYMNLSGQAVGEAARFYKIDPDHIFVIHDELDLELGKIKVKKGGGAGGHNGLKDIDTHMGKDYWRVRMGIGHPGDKDQVSPYVLSNFKKDETKTVENMITAVSEYVDLLITGNDALFMTRVNEKMKK